MKSVRVKLVTPDNLWAIMRDIWNDKGEEAAIAARVKDLLDDGFIENARLPPFLFEDHLGRPHHFDAAHWATMFQSLERIWRSDPKSEVLRLLLEHGVAGASVLIIY